MNCLKCGKAISNDAAFCPFCGAKQTTALADERTLVSIKRTLTESGGAKRLKDTISAKTNKNASIIASVLIAVSIVFTLFGWLTPRDSTYVQNLNEYYSSDDDLKYLSSDELTVIRDLKNGSVNAFEIPGFYKALKTSYQTTIAPYEISMNGGTQLLKSFSPFATTTAVFLYGSLAAALFAIYGLKKRYRWAAIPYALGITLLIISIMINLNKVMEGAGAYYWDTHGDYPAVIDMKIQFSAYLCLIAAIAAAAVPFVITEKNTETVHIPVYPKVGIPYKTDRAPLTDILPDSADFTTVLKDDGTATRQLSPSGSRIVMSNTIIRKSELSDKHDSKTDKKEPHTESAFTEAGDL